jgi:hypothetical protein
MFVTHGFWAWIMGYIVLDDIITDVNYYNFNQKGV